MGSIYGEKRPKISWHCHFKALLRIEMLRTVENSVILCTVCSVHTYCYVTMETAQNNYLNSSSLTPFFNVAVWESISNFFNWFLYKNVVKSLGAFSICFLNHLEIYLSIFFRLTPAPRKDARFVWVFRRLFPSCL